MGNIGTRGPAGLKRQWHKGTGGTKRAGRKIQVAMGVQVYTLMPVTGSFWLVLYPIENLVLSRK